LPVDAPVVPKGEALPMSGSANGKTLILVGSIPGGKNVGQILLREMLACLDSSRFVIAALLDAGHGEVLPPDPDPKIKIFLRPREHVARRYQGRIGGLLAAIARVRDYEPAIAVLAKNVAEFAAANDVRQVWGIFNMTTAIDVCARLIESTGFPLQAHVWDDVEHICQQRNLDAVSRRRTAKRFAKLLARAERTAVIGESMRDNYTRRFGAKCQIVRHGVADSTQAREVPTSDSEFVIGFSGGMYCPSAWKALQSALAKVNWTLAGKRVRLIVMGAHITLNSRGPANIEFLGWRAESEVYDRLANCDLLYLPQPFEGQQRAIAELSFPSKLSAYVSTGRPIMIHGPTYASLQSFKDCLDYGVSCTSLDPAAIAQALESFAADHAAYRHAAEAVAAAANGEFSRSNFESQVRSFLNAPNPAVTAV